MVIRKYTDSIMRFLLSEQKDNPIPAIEAVGGFSAPKGRRLLNCIGKMVSPLNYLEIGTHIGSTFISTLYDNFGHLEHAYAIDNWSEFNADGTVRDLFYTNCNKLIQLNQRQNVKVFEQDCFTFDLSHIVKPVNFYLYDGNHAEESQRKAYTYFNPILDNIFITVVDDWNWDFVRQGTRKAFSELNYKIEFEEELFTPHNGDTSSWWNGLLIAVIRKS